MSSSLKRSLLAAAPVRRVMLALSAAHCSEAACRRRRPPPPVYAPPPPASAAERTQRPADDEVQATEAPPPLPDYDQPPCPEDGYLWTPGYWAWASGRLLLGARNLGAAAARRRALDARLLGLRRRRVCFHAGYWGPHIGFYGGVNYGFGYGGVGFAGGRWVGGAFAYNRSVTNVNVTIVHNTYNETVSQQRHRQHG